MLRQNARGSFQKHHRKTEVGIKAPVKLFFSPNKPTTDIQLK